MGFLVIIEPSEGEVREIRLMEGETSIGRDPVNALVLEGRGVSRRHAKLVLSRGRLTIVDLGSTYGTRVNDVTTLRRELCNGDEVLVGMNCIRVRETRDSQVGALPPTSENMPVPQPYFEEDVTEAPGRRQALGKERRRSNIQFVQDSPAASNQAVKILARHDSDLMKAVQRLGGTTTPISLPVSRYSPPGKGADYQALFLMYKVSELLAGAADLEDFVAPMADLILEEVRADTVVLLMLGEGGEMVPQVIRHRGALNPGEIPVSRSIIDRVMNERVSVMSNDVGQDDRLKSGQSVMLYKIRAVVALPLMVRGELRGVFYVSRSGLQAFSNADADLLNALVALVASGFERAELRDRVVREKQRRKALERFHPPEVVDSIFKTEAGDDSLDEHRVTVLVCDLQGFSSLVDRVPPRQLATVLHEYYELLYDKVFSNGGSLVKLHDGWALALFGSLHSPDKDAVWALETALEICSEFTSIAVLWPESQTMALRCVLDSGTVVAGVVGSADRLEYTAIGSPIGTAANLAQQLRGTQIILTERTRSELPVSRYKLKEEESPIPELRIYRIQR